MLWATVLQPASGNTLQWNIPGHDESKMFPHNLPGYVIH